MSETPLEQAIAAAYPAPTHISMGWRPISCLKLRMMAAKLRKADPSDETASLLEEAAADMERMESLHRSEIADMAERFRSVNVSEAVKQLADILQPAPAELSVGWQSMETAPLDGKHCILAIKTGAFVYSIQGAFMKGKWMNAASTEAEPLAWMPNVLLPDEFCPWTDEFKARRAALASTEGAEG